MGVLQLTAHIHPQHIASQRVAAAVGLVATTVIDADGEIVWSKDGGLRKSAPRRKPIAGAGSTS